MKVFLLLAFICSLTNFGYCQPFHQSREWKNFKIKHEKVYESEFEERLRSNILLDNRRLIKKHNAKFEKGEVSYLMAVTKFSDLTSSEFAALFTVLDVPKPSPDDESIQDDAVKMPAASTMDWRDYGAVTEVKNQGHCGSCYSFGATGKFISHFVTQNLMK